MTSKIANWFRIQRRMFWLYTFEFYDDFISPCLRPIRILVNLVLLFSCFVWLPPIFIVSQLWAAWDVKKSGERSSLTGKIWYWEQFNLY